MKLNSIIICSLLSVLVSCNAMLWHAAYNSDIDFWGQVVDPQGNPISGAKIDVIVYDDSSWSFEGGDDSEFELQADANGSFSILDDRGASIMVKASKQGYTGYIDPKHGGDLSKADIMYVGKDDNLRHKRPTEEDPVVLVLRKKSDPANLMIKDNGFIKLDKEGAVKSVSLKNDDGKGVDFKLRLWSDSPVPFTYDRYDWSAEIRVDKGLLQPVTEKDPVKAPLAGYKNLYKIEMNKDSGPNDWRAANYNPNHFWVKLDSGDYVKAEVEFETGRKDGVRTKIWYNLDGTRNFEGWDEQR